MTTTITIRINTTDQAKAQKVLDELAHKITHPEGGLKIIGAQLLKVQNARFDSQSDPDGKPWAKLAPLTVATRGGATGPILRRSGQLKRSGAWQVSGATLRVGVNTIYAAAQQFGVTIKPVKAKRLAIPMGGGKFVFADKVTIPARPMVGFGARDETATRHAVEDWLDIGKTGG